ncbi:uncharacterized protein LOC128962019 [Oppia nitens]|uniref:uncharacterized protein LOC128953463 n=1 Tax=Oppia nitens TaxID=1686743 RepID=UPI0023DA2FE4|nr:uncharacterized protein LOC128953463 [Oppia nitens]XP_054164216.1 uncharacterized protein LOC128961914 [Oppia nitens]XP_054164314.1 uncharacterized protein LOC128962019 [Oppia nitens]
MPYQGAIEGSQIIQYRPKAPIADTNTIEFEIQASTDEYIYMPDIFLWLKYKVINQNGNDFADTLGTEDNYSPVNYVLNTAFDQLAIYLGNTLVSQASKNYNYLSFIEAVTNITNISNQSISPSGFVTSYWNSDYEYDKPDPILLKMVRKSTPVSLYGKLHGPIFTTNRLLISGVPIKLIFTKAPPCWPVIGKDGWWTNDTFPHLKIMDMSLFVRKVKIAPNILNAHAQALRLSRAIYPIKRPFTKVVNLSAGQSSFNIDNVIIGQLPHKLILGLVTEIAYNGNNRYDPLKFSHNNLTYLALNVNGEMLPKLPFQPNYDIHYYTREYHDFLLNIGANAVNFPPPIDYTNYKTANALKLIVYAVFDNTIEIDENRNVTVDYS